MTTDPLAIAKEMLDGLPLDINELVRRLLDHCSKHEKSGRAQFSTTGIRTLAEAYIAERAENERKAAVIRSLERVNDAAFAESTDALQSLADKLTAAESRIKELEGDGEAVGYQQRHLCHDGEWSDWYTSDKDCFDDIRAGVQNRGVLKFQARALYTRPDPSEEVERLREALEFYANPEIYKPHPHGPAFDRRDLSATAVAALRAEEKMPT